jgi:hypothetical protein
MSKEADLTRPLTRLDIDSRAAHIRDKFEIPQDQVNRLQQKYPHLFSEDEITARQTELAQEFGITNHQSLIKVFPEILGLPIDKINSKFDRLSQIGFNSPQTAVNSYPQLIITQNYEIQSFIKKVEGFGLDGLTMLNNYPIVLTASLDNIQNQINFLKSQQFSNPHHIIESCPRICFLKKDFITNTLNKFHEAGFDAKDLLEKSPGWFDLGILRINSLKREFPSIPNSIFVKIISQNPHLGQIKSIKEAIEEITKQLKKYSPSSTNPDLPPVIPESPQTRQTAKLPDKSISTAPTLTAPKLPQVRPEPASPNPTSVSQPTETHPYNKSPKNTENTGNHPPPKAPDGCLSISGIAKKFGISRKTIRLIINQHPDEIGPINNFMFGKKCTKGYSPKQIETIEKLLNSKDLLHPPIQEGYLSMTGVAKKLQISPKTLEQIINDHRDEIGPTKTYKSWRRPVEGYSPEQIEIIEKIVMSKGLLHPPAPEGYLSMTNTARKLQISLKTFKQIINDHQDEIGPTKTYRFGKRTSNGYSPEQVEIIEQIIRSKRSSSPQETEKSPKTKPSESLFKTDNISKLSPPEQKKLLIQHLNQQYSLNLAIIKPLVSSRPEKISLIAQILSFYPNNPDICHKKTHFLAVTPIEDILIAFTKRQSDHTILNFCNEVRISNKQKLSLSNKHQLITDFFNQHPEFKHFQTLYQKMMNSKYLSPQPPETAPDSPKLTFIKNILDFYPKTNPEYLSQTIEALSSIDSSSIFTAFILKRPQDSLIELVEKAKHCQDYFSNWDKKTIINLFLNQHIETKKIVQSFLDLTSSS